MALVASYGLDDVYKRLKGQWREIRAAALRLRTAAAAGPISFTTARDYFESLYAAIAFCDSEIAKFGGAVLSAYAQAQEDIDGYDPSAEYTAMRLAAEAVVNHITAALPPNSTHTVANGRVVEPTFSVAQTAALRSLLDTLIARIGAP